MYQLLVFPFIIGSKNKNIERTCVKKICNLTQNIQRKKTTRICKICWKTWTNVFFSCVLRIRCFAYQQHIIQNSTYSPTYSPTLVTNISTYSPKFHQHIIQNIYQHIFTNIFINISPTYIHRDIDQDINIFTDILL